MSISYSNIVVVGAVENLEEFYTKNSSKGVAFNLHVTQDWVDETGQKLEVSEVYQIITLGTIAFNCAKWLTEGRLVLVRGKPRVLRDATGTGGLKKFKSWPGRLFFLTILNKTMAG